MLYIGADDCKLKSSFQNEKTSHEWTLINFHEYDPEPFWNHPQAEVALLAIFCIRKKWPETRKTEVLEQVLISLKDKSRTAHQLKRLLLSAELLSNITDIQPITVQLQNKMTIRYDIDKDVRFQQGIEKGKLEGIIKLLNSGMPVEKILEYLNLIFDTEEERSNARKVLKL